MTKKRILMKPQPGETPEECRKSRVKAALSITPGPQENDNQESRRSTE